MPSSPKPPSRIAALGIVLLCACPPWPRLSAASAPAQSETIVTWSAPLPDVTRPLAGLPRLDGVKHQEIFKGRKGESMFNHGPIGHHIGGRFWVTWYSHRDCEDAVGQRVLFSHSADGLSWAPARAAFDSLSPMGWRGETGFFMWPRGLRELDGRIYALARVVSILDWPDPAGAPRVETVGLVAREISPAFGPAFWLEAVEPDAPALAEILAGERRDETLRIAAARLLAAERAESRGMPKSADPAAKLCEPTWFFRPDGVEVCILRDDARSLRLFASTRETPSGSWSPAVKTAIPDSPSKTHAETLPDGRVVLIGNFLEKLWLRDPLILALSNDGRDFSSARVLRGDAPPLREKRSLDGKGSGFQYPHALLHEGALWVFYSVGKEDIAVSRVPLDRLD